MEREFNLSYTDALPEGNQVVAGHRLNGSGAGASVEEGIAKTLGIRLGDTLRFDVAGQTVQAPVTSLRKLDWGSMRVNFFVILPPAAMHGLPETYITAFHLPPASAALGNWLTAAFPNTVVNTDLILRQIQAVLDQVIAARSSSSSSLSPAGGVTVLYAALSGRARRTHARRGAAQGARRLRRGAGQADAVCRVPGGRRACMGSRPAFLAPIAVGWALSQHVFDFPYCFNPWIAPIAAWFLACCAAFAGGRLGLRDALAPAGAGDIA
ncbi:hypothetical protein ACTMU2_09305 [Cupriavidus basilensis]